MAIIFKQCRAGHKGDEIVVTTNRQGIHLPKISISRHDESVEINSIKVEIIDNKPLYIPLGKTEHTYKCQFKTFTILDFNAWYTVLGNDVLEVISSKYPEFPEGSYWNVENITSRELLGSAHAIISDDYEGPINPGEQIIIMEYELEVSKSETDFLGRPRE